MKISPKRELVTVPVKKFIDEYIYRIDLDADYQREKIWSRRNQEDLLDSILKNIDIPKLYLARTDDKDESFDYECIDGKQRMSTLLSFFKPEPDEENPLVVRIAGEKFTYRKLTNEHPTLAKKIEDFELTLVIYPKLDDEDFVREIFRRLQLGVRLNSGELLNSLTGAVRDFVFKEMGREAPFLRHTNLSEKRYSRQFTLAQICINSFSRKDDPNEFVRARFDDLEEFFNINHGLSKHDANFARIRKVLEVMEHGFGNEAQDISSRAVAVTAYLFVEDLCAKKRSSKVPAFAKFFSKLLEGINEDLKRVSDYERPKNRLVLEEFQKHITQASVESFAIKRRHVFVEKAFAHYLKTKGKILGS